MTLYDIIAELRRENASPEASRTLDMAVTELGRTRDNLRHALMNLEERPIPPGGREVLSEFEKRARKEDLFDLDYGPPPPLPGELALEELDDGQVGIGLLLVGTSLAVLALAAIACVLGVMAIIHSSA